MAASVMVQFPLNFRSPAHDATAQRDLTVQGNRKCEHDAAPAPGWVSLLACLQD